MSAPLRILMTADAVGGVWNYCVELAGALQAYDVEISLAVMGGSISPAQASQIARLTNVHLFESDYRLEWMNDPWSDVDAAGDWLLAIAQYARAHVVHLNGYAHAALSWDAPVMIVTHSCVCSWWRAVKGEEAPTRYSEYRRRVENGLRNADLIVTPTSAMQNALEREYNFCTEQLVIANGRDPAFFGPATKEPFIFSAGRIWDEAKNIALLERIAPELNWPVVVAGDTSAPGQRTQFSGGSSLVRLGRIDEAELATHLAKASIYAAPARYEPFGLGILEAALSGCALVLSDIASLRENWSGAAIFLPADDNVAWRDALNALAADKDARADLATRARARAARFTSAKMAAEYMTAYRALIAAHRSAELEMSVS